MRDWFRTIISVLAFILGTGTLLPLVEANWHEWARTTGNDQYIIRFAEPIMAGVVGFAQTGWFIFAAGFFVGGAVCLWLEFLVRHQSPTAVPSKAPAPKLDHALHLVSSTGMNVIVDQRKKKIQIGFRLKNSSSIPLRYEVRNISANIEGKTVLKADMVNKGGIVAKDDIATYLFAAIPCTVGKKDVQAEASIVYRYGPAGPGEPPVREANYRVQLTISPKSHAYLVLEENDAEI
jgi:hypothetical protein